MQADTGARSCVHLRDVCRAASPDPAANNYLLCQPGDRGAGLGLRMVARVTGRLRRRLDRCYGETAGFSPGLRRCLSRCDRAHGACGALAPSADDDTTTTTLRTQPATTSRTGKVGVRCPNRVKYQRLSPLAGTPANRPALTGVRIGNSQAAFRFDGLPVNSDPRSCHRAKRGPASGQQSVEVTHEGFVVVSSCRRRRAGAKAGCPPQAPWT